MRMKRLIVVMSALVLVLATSVAAVSAQDDDYPPADVNITVPGGVLDPGDCVQVELTGVAPGTVVTFVLTDSDGAEIASTTVEADEFGVAAGEVCVPDDAVDGGATITAVSPNDGTQSSVLGKVELNIGAVSAGAPAVQSAGGLAFTGRTFGGLLGAGALALVIGAVLLGVSRQREAAAF